MSDPLDSRIESASTELRSQLGSAPLPDFEPNKRVAAPVAAIVALLVAVGAIAATQLTSNNASQVDVADNSEVEGAEVDGAEVDGAELDSPDDGEAPNDGEPAPVEQPAEPGPGRTAANLVTPAQDVQLTIGMDDTQPSVDRARPALGEQRNDPAYNSVVTRLTDAGGRFNRLDNSSRSFVNSDGTLFISHIDDGAMENMAITNLETLDPLTVLDLEEESELVWHPTEPNLLRHLSGWNASTGSLRLFQTDVTTKETTVIADLTDRLQEVFPTAHHMVSGHGRPGLGGDVWVWIVRDQDEDPVGVVSYDLSNDSITGTLSELDPTTAGKTFTDAVRETLTDGPGRLLSVAVTSDAKYAVADYESITTVHDIGFSDFRAIENLGDSSDVVAMPNGTDAYVFVDFNQLSQTYGFVTAVNLDTFERTGLINLFDNANTSVIVSGASASAPGWVVLSTFDCKNSEGTTEPWTCNKIMVVEVGGEGRIVPLAHTYGCSTDQPNWFAIPYASASPDFSRILFTSDSGACTDGAEVFEILVPDELRQLTSAR